MQAYANIHTLHICLLTMKLLTYEIKGMEYFQILYTLYAVYMNLQYVSVSSEKYEMNKIQNDQLYFD